MNDNWERYKFNRKIENKKNGILKDIFNGYFNRDFKKKSKRKKNSYELLITDCESLTGIESVFLSVLDSISYVLAAPIAVGKDSVKLTCKQQLSIRVIG